MPTKSNNMRQILNILDEYQVVGKERKELLKIIKPIMLHPEFQRRFTDEFPHHGAVSVSLHIIEDSVKTYKLAKRYLKRKHHKNFSLEVAVYTAMFHDLYVVAYQNNEAAKVNKFKNIHGFRHPIEAVINSYSWYSDIYKKYGSDKLIDGIVHHMYPFPVMVVKDDGNNSMELKNYPLYEKLPDDIKENLERTSHRGKIGAFSFARSKYKEGRLMSRADKLVTIRQLKHFGDWVALLTGKNKDLKK